VSFAQQQRLTGLEEGNQLGYRVAIAGDTAVVGVNYEAYVFVRDGNCWTLQQKLAPSDGSVGLRFSSSVAISGDTIVVGANAFTIEQGKAYVFVRSGGVWTEQQILKASDGAFADFAGFGDSVTIQGDTAIVGAPGIGSESTATQEGAAYVFVRNGTTWTEQQKLKASDRARGDLFGDSVELSGNTLIVGAPLDDVGVNIEQGSAYIFVRSGTSWTEQQKLTAADGARQDRFGRVAISGDTAIVGATGGQGAAYVFVRSGATWMQQQKLRLPDGVTGDAFGLDVAMDGDTAVIGAPGEDTAGEADSNDGAAYIFVRSGATWVRQQRLVGSAESAGFGGGVAISGENVLVDTGEDFAHIYVRTDGTTSPRICTDGKPLQLLNIATRLRVQTGENVLIGGLIVTGSQPKKVILRAIGPSLAGVFSGALSDPVLELYQGDTLLARNENWKDSQQAEIEATTIPPSHELESSIVQTLPPGSYTAVMSGHSETTGIGVIEVYDLDQAANSRLANIASRGFVEAGDNVMIGGLIVGGDGSTDARILIRAIGPSLGNAGVADALADPTLELRDVNGEILRENDDWQQSQQAEIEATSIPPSDPAESALIVTLPSGNYTAVVRGKGDTSGVGLVEVYNLP
jgi:hypothetical protein